MLTIQDIGNETVYMAALKIIKRDLSFGKKLFKKNFTREEALQVKALAVHNTQLLNLDFLRFFPNLKEFEIVDSKVNNFDGLQFCSGLTYFAYYLEEKSKVYAINDFSFLQSLSELEVLCITGNNLEDVSVLENLKKVKHLVLENNPIKTIAPLKGMQSLEHLEVECCGLSSLEDLGEFKALKAILAEGNSFTEEQKEEYHAKYPHIEIDFEN